MTNNIKHSFRALYRQKGYFLINVIGLSIGIACSMIIAIFIMHELSYDRFNEKKDRLFRLVINGRMGDKELSYAITSAAIGPAMQRDFPEVENFSRVLVNRESLIKFQEKVLTENNFILADSSFFDLFTVPLLRGDKKTVLNAGHKLVISQAMAKKIFGDSEPMDKMIRVDKDTIPFIVTGIMKDIPENSHFNADMIGSFMTYGSGNDNNWNDNNNITYLLLKPGTKAAEVNAKMPAMIIKYLGPAIQKSFGITIEEFISKNNYNIYLQALKDIHLNPAITQYTKPSANPKYLFIFGGIAIFIIIIAAFNYMNLATAQASRRSKEVGIKKLSGSSKFMLARQFIGESFFLSFISLLFAVIIVENFLPIFSKLVNSKLHINYFDNWITIPALIVLTFVIGFLAGTYPAFKLSSMNIYTVLKGKLRDSLKAGQFRKLLVILQFTISIILIIGTLLMFRQIQFMLKKDLGFNKEQLLVLSRAETIGNNTKSFKEALAKIPGIKKVSASSAVPGRSESGTSYVLDGRPGELYEFKINYIDFDFFETYGIALHSGRTFNEAFATDKDAIIINETTIKQLNLANPLTSSLRDDMQKFPVIGVVKDFHYESLHNEISPYIFRLKNEYNSFRFFSLRLSGNANANTIKDIETMWKKFAPDSPMQYYFMDQDFEQKYREERQNARLSIIFTLLAILIAGLGLFGLTSITIDQRTKEIGIRKTMGASELSILALLSKDFLILISISTLLAWPVIFFLAKNWLQNYYYRINLRPFEFLAGLIIAGIITMLVIGYHTIKSSKANPVESLRYE